MDFGEALEKMQHRLSEPRCSKIQDHGQGMESVSRKYPGAGL